MASSIPWAGGSYRWEAAPVPAASQRLEQAGVAPLISRLLAQRGLEEPAAARRFLSPSLDQLHAAPMRGLEEAVEMLAAGRSRQAKVVVVGDYDVDGLCATALLVATLRACGLEVEPILPHRLREGYGLQPVHVERAVALGARILVAVDCGTTAREAVARALAEGLEVVVVDHHLPGDPLPEEAVLVNPRQAGCCYPFQDLAASGLAFKLAVALAGRCGRAVPIPALLRIACLGTIADMVPLVGENRVLAALGLGALGDTRSAGLRELMRVAGLEAPYQAADVGFRLGPRLNAAGRLGSPEPALELLLTRDPRRAREICRQLEELNHRRREEQQRIESEALETLSRCPGPPPVVVAWSDSWHQGVVGIAASRIARLVHRPTVLFAVRGETATGSGRGIPGFDLFAFLAEWRPEMERFGGHAQAVGLSVRASRLEELRAAWLRQAAQWSAEPSEPVHTYCSDVDPGELGAELVELLDTLAPWGEGNPQPLLRVGPLRVQGPPRTFGKGHLRCRAEGPGGSRVSLLGWGWGGRQGKLQGDVDVLGYLERDRLTGGPVLRLVDSRPTLR
jgi:single-stranded-DNA-specific exonuclease